MTVKLYKPLENKIYDITKALASFTWSGATLSAGRTLEISYVNAPYDKYVNLPQISVGDFVSLSDDSLFSNQELFYGQFLGITRSSATGTISFTAYDSMKNLLESTGKYNFKNMTPEAIAVQVLTDLQVPYGTIVSTGINIKSLLADGTSFYDIIMGSYTQAHKINGKYYMAMIWDRKFNVYEAKYYVSKLVLSDELNITSSSIEESSDQIVNRVKIYDDKGNQIGEVKDDGSISKFGVYQNVYSKEDGADPMAAAKSMLSVTPKQKITVNVIGDINCLSGYNVKVHDGATGLDARYWIISDKHTWSNGIHMMDLELQFDQIMDEKEIQEEEAKS